MKSLCNVLSMALYYFLITCTGLTSKGRKTSSHDCKNVGSDAKHHYKQAKSTQKNNRDSLRSLIFLQSCASTGTQV